MGTRSAFDTIEQIEFVVVRLFDFFARQCEGFAWGSRSDQEWGDQNQQFLLDAAVAGIAEKWSEVGQIAQSRDSRCLGVERDLEETGERERSGSRQRRDLVARLLRQGGGEIALGRAASDGDDALAGVLRLAGELERGPDIGAGGDADR